MTFLVAGLTALTGLALVQRVIRDFAGKVVASWTALALLFGTFLFRSLQGDSAVAPAASFALAAAALAFWWDGRRGETRGRLVLAGFAALASATVPWIAEGAIPRPGPWRVEESLFASPRGLLFASPILWGGFIGLILLARREGRRLAAPVAWLALLLVVFTARGTPELSGAGGSFHAALPALGLGLGASLEWLRSMVARRPWVPIVAGGALLTVWNFLFMEQYRTDKIPRDLPISFTQVTETNAAILSRAVGSPPAWPANWLFAWRYSITPAKYDVLVGSSLLPASGGLALSLDDPRVDPDLLAEGWGGRTSCDGIPCRRVATAARLFLPLDERRSPGLALNAVGPGWLSVEVNSARVADVALGATLAVHEIPGAARLWRSGVNEVRLSYQGPAEARIAGLALGFEEEP